MEITYTGGTTRIILQTYLVAILKCSSTAVSTRPVHSKQNTSCNPQHQSEGKIPTPLPSRRLKVQPYMFVSMTIKWCSSKSTLWYLTVFTFSSASWLLLYAIATFAVRHSFLCKINSVIHSLWLQFLGVLIEQLTSYCYHQLTRDWKNYLVLFCCCSEKVSCQYAGNCATFFSFFPPVTQTIKMIVFVIGVLSRRNKHQKLKKQK